MNTKLMNTATAATLKLPNFGKHSVIYLAIAASGLLVLLADLNTPLGFVVWIGYLLPVTLTLATDDARLPPSMALLATATMIYTFFAVEPAIDPTIAALNRLFGVLTIWTMGGVGYYFISNRTAIQHQQRLHEARAGLSEVMEGEQDDEVFGNNVLKFLASFSDAQAGAMFIHEGDRFRRIATYGVPAGAQIPEKFSLDDGLLGQAARDRQGFLLQDIPDGYLQWGSSLGQAKPTSLIIVPIHTAEGVNGVLELGFMRSVSAEMKELLESLSEPLSVAVRSGSYRTHLQALLTETQRQADELQAQSEELRAANEELEEQSRALQESHAHLEQHQASLEQSNAQLEEQTRLLEEQRDGLERARATIEEKALELQRASQYKTDFLANMSHELRTPLNSSLILARLLADNPQGNLTDEQVESAETIVSSGNDLLILINDILDLSKIEAGHMEIATEPVRIARLQKDLGSALRPLAEQKGLRFTLELAADCPDEIITDRHRLEQVLKNLLANAVKFTEQGEVALRIKREADSRISFAVSDTGIGIADDQHQMIFEAFHQGDSADNRRFSGTGLGLSISRELVQLLGGEIHVSSRPDHGSTFTVVLPEALDTVQFGASPRPAEHKLHSATAAVAPRTAEHETVANTPPSSFSTLEDDRDTLRSDDRTILVVEDDEAFARILFDLAHEMDFKCLLAMTADEAMIMAAQYVPSAVVLDIGLPDHSGLAVLDRLKHDTRTRHIPVHVISADDYTETAKSLGAAGYMLKPVTREMLIQTLKGLEDRMVQKMRRVLVVEDDDVQRESLQKLLRSQNVETVGASSAAQCLEELKESTFDCMVLDLSLPDTSGHALLETLSREDDYAFPPVVVYTGRDVSAEEEQKLRRYSRSIIIKGAKSPERLLDEVTLFLHQVISELPARQQKLIQKARNRDATLEGRRILVVEDDVRNIFALSSILEPQGALVQIARNGREALEVLEAAHAEPASTIDLVLMDVMMPEMDGITATREIRQQPQWKNLPIIMLTAKAMQEDQQTCLNAGANDYMAKPLDVDKLLSLVRVWISR